MPIGNTITHGITLGTTGTYASPLTITSTGYIDNTGTGDGIYGSSGQFPTVINYGRVAAPFGIGVDLAGGGLVVNHQARSTGSALVPIFIMAAAPSRIPASSLVGWRASGFTTAVTSATKVAAR